MRNVVVTCGGHWVSLVLQLKDAMRSVQVLREGRIFVADRAAGTPAGWYADGAFQVPSVDDAQYVDRLMTLCTRERIRVVVPHLELDLRRLAPHRERFAKIGVSLVCPPEEIVELCGDKKAFESFARAHQLPWPHCYSADDLREELFPLFAKRRRGTASQGARMCRSLPEAREAAAYGAELIFQPVATGAEVSVDAFISTSGACTVRVPRVRDKTMSGEATRTHTIRAPELISPADRAIAALARRGLHGPLNLQFFLGKSITLIDVNPRLGSASVLGNRATGGRFYSSILQEACGEITAGDPDDYQEGLHLYRYWGEVYHDSIGPRDFTPPKSEGNVS